MRVVRTVHLCDRARGWVSLQLDGELSKFEGAILSSHLRSCAGCRAFRAEAAAFTDALREAELEPLPRPVVLPRRRHPALRGARVSVAAAAVAALGLGALFNSLRAPEEILSAPRTTAPMVENEADRLRERQLNAQRERMSEPRVVRLDRPPGPQIG